MSPLVADQFLVVLRVLAAAPEAAMLPLAWAAAAGGIWLRVSMPPPEDEDIEAALLAAACCPM